MSRAVEAAPETESRVWSLVADVVARPVRAVTRMGYGHGSVTYLVDVDGSEGGSVIVRTNTDPRAYAGTLANLDTLRSMGLPVPMVLAADLTMECYPFAYVVTDTFPGRDLGFELAELSAPQITRLAEQIVGFERTVSALPLGHGYGFMPIGAAGGHGRWVDAVRADRGWVGSGVDAGPGLGTGAAAGVGAGGGVGSGAVAGAAGAAAGAAAVAVAGVAEVAELIADVRVAIDRAEPRLEAIEPVCFLDDLTTKNVIVHDGVLRGVVDFDVVCYGDPMYWLALTQVAVMHDVGTSGQFYVDELTRLWKPSAFEWANLALYSALHAAEFLSWPIETHTGAATDRRARLMQAARSWIAAAR